MTSILIAAGTSSLVPRRLVTSAWERGYWHIVDQFLFWPRNEVLSCTTNKEDQSQICMQLYTTYILVPYVNVHDDDLT